MCTEEFQLSESIYGKCMNINVKGSVDGIPAELTRQMCGHRAPNDTGKIHQATPIDQNHTDI